MKFLFIFKDSLREAIDTKVFYFTVGFSLLVVLLIGTVRFRPVTFEEQLRFEMRLVDWVLREKTQGPGLEFTLDHFEQTNSAAEPWNGDYRFVLTLPTATGPSAADIKMLLRSLPSLSEVEVTAVPGTPGQMRYQVQTHGTKVTDRREWGHVPGLFFGALPLSPWPWPLGVMLLVIADYIFGTVGIGAAMLLSTIVTAFFIPNMLRKGTIDLLLSRPIYRSSLFFYKFLGGLTFMFLNTVVALAGLWLALGLQTQVWLHGLLVAIFVFTLQFAIFYAISTLMAVLTRSAIVAILVAVAAWPLLFGVGWFHRYLDTVRPERLGPGAQQQILAWPAWIHTTIDVAHYILPRYKDFDVLTTRLLYRDLVSPDSELQRQANARYTAIRWDEALGVTLAWIVVLVGLACWRFSARDY